MDIEQAGKANMKISVKKAVKFITDPRTAGVGTFIGVGSVKTIYDYKKAEPQEKRKTLAYDAAVIAGTAVAYTGLRKATNLLCETQIVDNAAKVFSNALNLSKKFKPIKHLLNPKSTKVQKVLDLTKKTVLTSLETTETIFKDCIAGVLNTFFGFLGAIYSSALMKKYVLNKPFFNPEPTSPKEENKTADQSRYNGYFQNSQVFQNFNMNSDTAKTVKHITTTVLGMPQVKIFDTPLMAVSGISIAETKGYHNKFKKTTYSLLAYTLVPTFFYSLMTAFVKNAKPIIKYPLLIASLIGGTYAGKAIGDKYKDKIDKEIDKIDMRYIAIK